MPTASPVMTVILIVGDQRERAGRCLSSILRQSALDRLEVLVLDCAAGENPPLPGSDHPAVRLHHVPPSSPYGKVRAHAVRMSSSPIVAFIEEHCTVMPGWAEAIGRAHEGPWAGVCGEVHNGNPGVGISDAVALMNYTPWLPPARRGESEQLPGHNTAYKRECLLALGESLEKLLRTELLLQWKLAEKGYRLYVEPDARFAHANETRLRDLAEGYYLWNRCFGHTRAEVFRWSRGRRALRVALSPLIPWVRLAKLFVFTLTNRPEHLGQYFRFLPAILAAQASSAVGQAAGLLFGLGDADVRFLRYETSKPRETGRLS